MVTPTQEFGELALGLHFELDIASFNVRNSVPLGYIRNEPSVMAKREGRSSSLYSNSDIGTHSCNQSQIVTDFPTQLVEARECEQIKLDDFYTFNGSGCLVVAACVLDNALGLESRHLYNLWSQVKAKQSTYPPTSEGYVAIILDMVETFAVRTRGDWRKAEGNCDT